MISRCTYLLISHSLPCHGRKARRNRNAKLLCYLVALSDVHPSPIPSYVTRIQIRIQIRIHFFIPYSDAGTFYVQGKHALQQAMKLVYSPHASLKRLSVMNIANFFKAFPDLEEDVINGIYDFSEGYVMIQMFVAPRTSFCLIPDSPLPVSSPRCELKDTKLSFECQRVGREERGCLDAVTSERWVPHSTKPS
jgi:hypothetical protein